MLESHFAVMVTVMKFLQLQEKYLKKKKSINKLSIDVLLYFHNLKLLNSLKSWFSNKKSGKSLYLKSQS